MRRFLQVTRTRPGGRRTAGGEWGVVFQRAAWVEGEARGVGGCAGARRTEELLAVGAREARAVGLRGLWEWGGDGAGRRGGAGGQDGGRALRAAPGTQSQRQRRQSGAERARATPGAPPPAIQGGALGDT